MIKLFRQIGHMEVSRDNQTSYTQSDKRKMGEITIICVKSRSRVLEDCAEKITWKRGLDCKLQSLNVVYENITWNEVPTSSCISVKAASKLRAIETFAQVTVKTRLRNAVSLRMLAEKWHEYEVATKDSSLWGWWLKKLRENKLMKNGSSLWKLRENRCFCKGWL